MKSLPIFVGSAEHLRRRLDIRLPLLLCAKEMGIRYDSLTYLTGSGISEEEPLDWDVRVILPDVAFDKHDGAYWSRESAILTNSQARLHGIRFDVRIWPQRLWYRNDAVCLDEYETTPVVERAVSGPVDQAAILALIEQHKDNPDLHLMLGTFMLLHGDRFTALQAFARCIQLNPEHAGGWLNLGNIYYDAGDFRNAAVHYRRAMILRPDYAKAYVNLANTLVQLQVPGSALAFYDKALELEDSAAAHHNKGSALVTLKQFVLAEVELKRSLALNPCDDKTINTLGNLRMSLEEDYAAGAAYSVALELNPGYAALYTNLANIYMNLGRSREAILNYERGLVLEPKNPGVRYNLALSYLRAGNYKQGWSAYEGRWGFRELAVKARNFKPPMWKGEDLQGKRILIHAEQGMGDTFQFCRYVPLVANLGGVVYFEVQHRLQRVMANLHGVHSVLTRGLDLPEFDVHCPLMSCPALFKTELATVPRNIPYLRAWKWEVEQVWLSYPPTGDLRVGISWAGNPKYKKDRERSFSLFEFAPLVMDGVSLFSLQRGHGTEQLAKYPELEVIDASSQARDFAATAALIETLDLIIASDSSPIHLAGAMDKEVWLLLAYLPDWRWMESGETTPWYPRTRIFRQSNPGDWAGVFARVREALEVRRDLRLGSYSASSALARTANESW